MYGDTLVPLALNLCIFFSLSIKLPQCFKEKISAAVHLQPGGIRRNFDTPPPRQLSFFHVRSLVQAL